MGRVVLRADVATRCRELAGQEVVGGSANRLFISDTELSTMIDAAMRDLYDLLVQARGHEYYASTAPLGAPTVVDGQYGHDLPADFYQLLSCRALRDGMWRDLAPYAPSEAAKLRNSAALGQSFEVRYRLGGSYATDADPQARERVLLSPTPTSTLAVEVDYIPTYLTTTANVSYNGVQGWEDYAVYSVVAHMLAKEESDPSYWLGMKSQTESRIRALAGNRDASRPQYVVAREPLESRAGFRGFRRGWLP